MIKWKPIDNGHFASLYKDKLSKKSFLNEDIKKIFENSKDVLSKSINPNTKENHGRNAIPKWNFHKIIIGKDGRVTDTFASITKPSSKKFINLIEKEIRN